MAKKLINTEVKLGQNTLTKEAVLPFLVKALISGTDINTCLDDGFYRLNSNHAHAFPGYEWSIMLVIRGGDGSDTLAQIGIVYSTSQMYLRSGTISSIGNVPWKLIGA